MGEVAGGNLLKLGFDKQREDHREAGAAADLQDQFDRQQRNDAEGDAARGHQDADEIPDARPDDRDVRLQRVGIDHGGDRVGRVVEAVDELEAQRDQQRDPQQDERKDRGRR